MAPARRKPRVEANAESIRTSIESGSSVERAEALQELIYFFTKRTQGAIQSSLNDKAYHNLLEALFRCALSEKQAYLSGKKTIKGATESRLAATAEALRLAVNYGASKLKRKVARAIIDHVTQTLPGRDQKYIEPLVQDYIKALVGLLEQPANVEQLGALGGEGWLTCADFFIDAISRFLDVSDPREAAASGTRIRASPAPGTAPALSLAYSTGRSGTASTQRSSAQTPSKALEQLVRGILCLVGSANAPLWRRASEITQALLQVLQLQHLSIGVLQQWAFAALGCVVTHMQGDDLALVRGIAKDVIPLVSHWWHPRSSASQSESVNSVREEILRILFSLQLHVDALTRDEDDGVVLGYVEDALDALWTEYSKREDRARLQIADLVFSYIATDHFDANVFGLRPYDVAAERRWAAVEVIAILESIYSRNSRQATGKAPAEGDQPRKRRRVEDHPNRVRQRLASPEPGVKTTALQVLPFLLQKSRSSPQEISTMLADLALLVGDKQANTCSWAMIACASYAIQKHAKDVSLSGTWKQIWQITVRAVSLPGTSRAASALLHAILESELLPYHVIADDVNNIVAAADVSGPALLVDSSLVLMLHLLHLRNTILPNANQATSNHIIRWVFSRWKPADATYSSLYAPHVSALDVANLLRACVGTAVLAVADSLMPFGGPISQSWRVQKETADMMRYLLLLSDSDSARKAPFTCAYSSGDNTASQPGDAATSNSAKKAILDLLLPIIEECLLATEPWSRRGEGASQPSTQRVQSLATFWVVCAVLVPQLSGLNSTPSRDLEPALFNLVDTVLTALLDADQAKSLLEVCLTAVAPQIPRIATADVEQFCKGTPTLLRLLARLSTSLGEQQVKQLSGQNIDVMDLDDEFESPASQGNSTSNSPALPRQDASLSTDPGAFYFDIGERLHLLSIIHKDPGQIGLLPEAFLEPLLTLPPEQLLLARKLMRELLRSDLVVTPDEALKVVEAVGGIIGDAEYSCCEVALGSCIEVMEGLVSIWSDDKLEISNLVGDLYTHLIKNSLPKNSLSPKAQIALSRLLYRLLEVNPTYGTTLGLPSCRSSLFSVLQEGSMAVKFFIGANLPKIFSLYVLKVHDELFVDILENLPSDPEQTEGIAFRLLALAEMACKWPTLLRRCIYHIFETPGRLKHCAAFASHCLSKVSRMLSLESPKELFRLFAPQLLYTWLEHDSIDDIPYDIFGFGNLDDLVSQAQAEAAALMVMRGQDAETQAIAGRLRLPAATMIQHSFSKVVSYSFAHDIATAKDKAQATGESRIRKLLGKEPFLEAIYLNFADIVAALFDLIDQEDPIEKYFSKDPALEYAADIMTEIKKFGHSSVVLPPNQQPMFKAKFLARELAHLCSRTEYELSTLWTPALVASVARKLLNTIHPALGPLHACSVVRKVRVLICLAGPQATASYPLEMLLHSMRPFVQDAECADDALGITQYLLSRGAAYLTQAPSFFAGYALSMLASLRMFMESSQASTTQESQFKATMSKAQQFHGWFAKYLLDYDSPAFKKEEQRLAFRSITQSAAQIRASGNAEKETPESTLLLEILKDGAREDRLLDDSARDLALGMLCGDFKVPSSSRSDIIETDQDAVNHGAVVYQSCRAQSLKREYLVWAGRVVGRSFAASGQIHEELIRESRLSQYRKTTSGLSSSEQGLLTLLQRLSMNRDSVTAGLAEAGLRTIVSEATAQKANDLLLACQDSLSEALLVSSGWDPYRTPPSDYNGGDKTAAANMFSPGHIDSPSWSQDFAVHLAQCIPDDVVLSILPPVLSKVKGFAEEAFPFIVHLVLLFQLDKQQVVKREFSEAAKAWLAAENTTARDNVKLLVNTVLYLRTQPIPNETSIADRSQWLDIDLSLVATAASRCGMFKTALLFAELALSDTSRGSRRSSAVRDLEAADNTELLLDIFENIDDPDAYYGLPQVSSLSNVLARLEYEKDGIKTLAFRGAQYDSHLRQRDQASSTRDSQSLVQALSDLGLSGLSHSLLQTQQGAEGGTPASLDSMFTTAQRLGIWNLPTPASSDSHAVMTYKAYQSVHQASDLAAVQKAVYEGLGNTMKYITSRSLNVSSLRQHLGALAALTELDDVMNVTDYSELQGMLSRFEDRSKWMMSKQYDDVRQILSCRRTTLSTISQQGRLRGSMKISPAEARLIEIQGLLLSSSVYRFHHATQESLNLSTSLTDLIGASETLGLNVDAAIKMETANSLWDYGEMIPSIRMLQSVDKESALKKQTVHVSRSDLLSKIAHQVSVARLEGPDSIQKKYLEPALKELKGRSEGREAGQVFHQFAMFCDQQLQNPDSLEDLTRLQNLKKGKSDEVEQLKGLIATAKDSQMKNKYASHLTKAKQWLELDQQELRRVEQTRNEFVRLSLENYLLSLIASEEHNNDSLRFTALWLERSSEDSTNVAVRKYLDKVPTRKFAPLMNQLSSRLQDQPSDFQQLLIRLVYRICIDHPYHGMYQIWSGVKTRYNSKDEVAVLRQRATEKVSKELAKSASVASIWQAIDRTSRLYHQLAVEKKERYKTGHKLALKESEAAKTLMVAFTKYPIPPPTMEIELAADKDYSNVPTIVKLEPSMSIASGVSAPKIITAVGSNGQRYKQLVKGGNDDLRQDAIMEQVFSAVSSLLKLHRTSRQRNLGIRTYKVLPLTSSSGLIEFVPNTIPLHEYLMPAHEKYHPKDLKGSQCRKEISGVQNKTVETRIGTYRKVAERFHPVMRYFFMEYFPDPDEWFAKRLAYTRTTAAISMLGHVLGLGDRHGHNILLDYKTGEVVHIDLGVAFEMGRVLPVPELVPFRLTRDIVDGMGITKTEGVFRRCCEFSMDAMREETYSIMTILDVLRYDPLYSWSISPVRLAKLQDARRPAAAAADDHTGGAGGNEDQSGGDVGEGRKVVNEPSEADRALEVVRKKLSKTLSVTATVNDLINQATDERNLAVLYSGWAAYA